MRAFGNICHVRCGPVTTLEESESRASKGDVPGRDRNVASLLGQADDIYPAHMFWAKFRSARDESALDGLYFVPRRDATNELPQSQAE